MLANGQTIIHALKGAEVRVVVALPDIVTCETLLWPISADADFLHIPVCKEDEGVSICAALSYCSKRSVLLIQHTGFLDSINAIRAIAVEYQLPVVMMVGLQGMEPETHMHHSQQIGIRSLPQICTALNLSFEVLSENSNMDTVVERIADCYANSSPHVFFLP